MLRPGIEPGSLSTADFKSAMFTYFIIGACLYYNLLVDLCQLYFMHGAASRNRTHIHGVEDRCIIRYTMAANSVGGNCEIRTHGAFRLGSFQDCRIKPLSQVSVIKLI